MTIVSRGYEGQIMPNVEWAEWRQAAGHEYVASHYDAGRVSIVTTGTRTVRVNVGPVVNGLRTGIGGHGVFDAITVAEEITITGGLPGVGQSKWYLIAARRTWQTTQATTLVVIEGTSAEAIPPHNTTPGTVDDQPLALVQITNGSTLPTAVRDLRPVGAGPGDYQIVEPAARDLVMSYMNKVGYRLRVGTEVWERIVSGGSEVWDRQYQPTATRSLSARRSANDAFPAGVDAYLLQGSLPNPPAGLYLLTFDWRLKCTSTATAEIRATINGAELVRDQVDVDTAIRAFPVTVTYSHGGGALYATMFGLVSAGTGTVVAGTRITAVWQGPA